MTLLFSPVTYRLENRIDGKSTAKNKAYRFKQPYFNMTANTSTDKSRVFDVWKNSKGG